MDVIMGLAYPLSKTGQVADKQLASAILQEGPMAELFTSELFTTLHEDMHAPPIFPQDAFQTGVHALRTPVVHHVQHLRCSVSRSAKTCGNVYTKSML